MYSIEIITLSFTRHKKKKTSQELWNSGNKNRRIKKPKDEIRRIKLMDADQTLENKNCGIKLQHTICGLSCD